MFVQWLFRSLHGLLHVVCVEGTGTVRATLPRHLWQRGLTENMLASSSPSSVVIALKGSGFHPAAIPGVQDTSHMITLSVA